MVRANIDRALHKGQTVPIQRRVKRKLLVNRGSSSASIPKPTNLQSITVDVPLFVRPGFQPLNRRIHRFDGAALWHDPNITRRDPQCCNDLIDFVVVSRRIDHELDLNLLRAIDQSTHHIDGQPACFMQLVPARVFCGVGSTALQFGADRHQIALDVTIDGTCRFNRQVQTSSSQRFGQTDRIRRQHRFAAGQHHMRQPRIDCGLNNLVNALMFAGWFPRRVRRIAEPAAEITAAGADKIAFRTGQYAFTLPTGKSFTDAQRRPGRSPPSRGLRRVREFGITKRRNQS